MPGQILHGDCREILRTLPAHSVSSVATDPPYNLDTINKRFGAENAAAAKYGTDGLFQRQSKGFMQCSWDDKVAFDPKTWVEVLRVLKPGGWVAAMGSDRTHHRLMVAIEDAGFEIRHTIVWAHASGFPKALDVSAAIDKHLGAEREVVGRKPITPMPQLSPRNSPGVIKTGRGTDQYFNEDAGAITDPATPEAAAWQGWKTALKPAVEFIVLARAPLSEPSVAANVLKHGTGALNIDACRIGNEGGTRAVNYVRKQDGRLERWDEQYRGARNEIESISAGRYPSTLWLSHGPDCGEHSCGDGCPVAMLDAQSGQSPAGYRANPSFADSSDSITGWNHGWRPERGYQDTGGISRCFAVFDYEPPDPIVFVPKPGRRERDIGCEDLPDETRNRVNPGGLENDPKWGPVEAKNVHPTVKAVNLFRYIVRLITPPGGIVLDPFAGSGTTGCAAVMEGFEYVLIDLEEKHVEIARARVAHAEKRAKIGGSLLAKPRTAAQKVTPSLFGEDEF